MNRKTKILLWILAIVLLISAAAAIIVKNKKEGSTYFYNGRTDKFAFQIVRNDNSTQHFIKVYITLQGKEQERVLPFDYGPKELENIPLENEIYKKVLGRNIAKKFLYITQDPKLINQTQVDSVIAVQDIAKVTGQAPYSVFQIPTKAAYTYNDSNSQLAEFIDCKYASSGIGVILLKLGEETRVYGENECVIVEGKNGKEIRKAATKLVYHLLGVF